MGDVVQDEVALSSRCGTSSLVLVERIWLEDELPSRWVNIIRV
jgi:hypothetical protein